MSSTKNGHKTRTYYYIDLQSKLEHKFDQFYDLIESLLDKIHKFEKMNGSNIFEFTTSLELFQFLTQEHP